MDLVCMSHDSFRSAMRTGNNQIVGGKVKLFDSQRKKWQIGAVFFLRKGKFLNERRGNGGFFIGRILNRFCAFQKRVNGGRNDLIDRFESFFPPPPALSANQS